MKLAQVGMTIGLAVVFGGATGIASSAVFRRAELRASQAAAAADLPDPNAGARLFAGALTTYQQSPVRDQWANDSVRSLRPILESLGKKAGFEVPRIECRSESCVADLAWPSYDRAVETYQTVVYNVKYEPNCGPWIMLPQPKDPKGRYEARLLLSCGPTAGQGPALAPLASRHN